MVAQSDLEEFRAATASLSSLVRAEVQDLFNSLDLSRPEAARDALLEFIPVLTEEYGLAAAGLAAEWYEELRAASGAKGTFRATMAPAVEAAVVGAQVRFHAGHLWTPTPQAALSTLLTSVDKFVKQPARDTMRSNARREGVRYARVPKGSKTCAFCLTLASRDAVYTSKKSAGGDGNDFHGDCNCVVMRIGANEDYPADYLPDNYYEMYQAARDEAGSNSLNDITAAMRRLHPDTVRDGVHAH